MPRDVSISSLVKTTFGEHFKLRLFFIVFLIVLIFSEVIVIFTKTRSAELICFNEVSFYQENSPISYTKDGGNQKLF